MRIRLRCVGAAALLAVVVAGSGSRGEMITPNSIVPPPAVSPAVQGGAVARGGWVTDQFKGEGVVFPARMTGVDTGDGTAVVRVNGVKVWTGATYVAPFRRDVAFQPSVGVTASLVVPGTYRPAVADEVRVRVVASGEAFAVVDAFGVNGRLLESEWTRLDDGWRGDWVRLSHWGIHSIHVFAIPEMMPVDPPPGFQPPVPFLGEWGVAAINFSGEAVIDPPHFAAAAEVGPAGLPAPEPASLALLGAGASGFASILARRRRLLR